MLGGITVRNSPARSARRTVASSFWSAMGFSRKSIAPIRVASTAVSMVPWPDIMITGMVSCPLVAHSFRSVIPSASGIQMSSSTRSGRPRAREARAAVAFSASCTEWPSLERISDRSSRMPTSSSTIRICATTAQAARGREIRTVAPRPPSLSVRFSIWIVPWCSSMIRFTIASPRPVPLGLVVT